MKATDMVIDIIRNKVAVMNIAKDQTDAETMERFRHELTGMMVVLKNIAPSNEFYNINYSKDGYEFGYYDNDGRWYHIEGKNIE